jgi:probable rRNA maturation factor
MASGSGANIQFNYFKTTFRLRQAKKISGWIEKIVRSEKARVSSLSYVFCSDAYLLSINKEYLNHDTLTDIITFEYTETKGLLEGEIYISIPRVKENASKLGVDFHSELHRVIIHGVLHLLGYNDKNPAQRKRMRAKEEKCLGEAIGSTWNNRVF